MNNIFDIFLLEAKFRKPRVMFHGTSDKFLQSILKNGILPTPPQRTWDEDKSASSIAASRESLKGSYWTSNLLTATSSAWNTVKKFGGNQLIVIANISEQSAYADEDSINSAIDFAFSAAAKKFNLNSQTAMINIASLYYTDWNDAKDILRNEFSEQLHKRIGTEKQPIDKDFLYKVFDVYLMRKLAHAKKDGEIEYYSKYNKIDWLPEIKSVEEAEKDWLNIREKLTRKYKSSAIKDEFDFNHTLRINLPVTFKGANKIIAIIGDPPRKSDINEPDVDFYDKPRILYYGSVPEEYLKQYREKIGKFPGLITPYGKIVKPSEK